MHAQLKSMMWCRLPLAKWMAMSIGLAGLLAFAAASAQSLDSVTLQLVRTVQRQPNELARYKYLIDASAGLSATDRNIVSQFMSFSQNELGVYDEAVLGFPLRAREPDELRLPAVDAWMSRDAVDAIARLAAGRRIVMINEAHHDARTRQLTLALLPRLRQLGFTHFAAEALADSDPGLAQRGYPIAHSGTEYLREPLYGDIVREALRLGFVVVPYDSGDSSTPQREAAQAENLYRRVLAAHPDARLFVHAGYAHIDKAAGRLVEVLPMAARLQALSGLEPLSIDQTDIMETGWDKTDLYHRLIARFPSDRPEILLDRSSGKPWSARPALYDVSVILPPSLSMAAFGDQYTFGAMLDANATAVADTTRFPIIRPNLNHMQRPQWLTLQGQRRPYEVSTTLCRSSTPCVVEAHYSSEPDDATAADRYAFMQPNQATRLYLRPGRYRLRAWDLDGRTLSEREIDIARP